MIELYGAWAGAHVDAFADDGGGFGRRVRYVPSGTPEKFAELLSAADGPDRDGWHELAVANLTFLLERVDSKCTETQGLPLKDNGLDAIATLGADQPGYARYRPPY